MQTRKASLMRLGKQVSDKCEIKAGNAHKYVVHAVGIPRLHRLGKKTI